MQKSINSESTERESAAGQHAKSAFPPRQMEFCKSPVNPTQIIMICLWTGHEYPFGIKMSHIRDAMPHGSKHCACPRQLQGSFLTEQLPQELQCQFVLKPSRLAVCQQLNGTCPACPSIVRPQPRCLPGSAVESEQAGMEGAGGKQRGTRRCTFPAARGGLQCSSPWFECAVVCVSSLWVMFWQAVCQMVVLKPA